ncbi:hypothetical protein GGR57DRAFT_509002 [Xylariaceae sp. FL1272]|nr:hypothetical protein GGR57DRAFT_509002 [Xylariaceae sp. FL1272]
MIRQIGLFSLWPFASLAAVISDVNRGNTTARFRTATDGSSFDYPGKGGPCKNEFGYVNFDYSTPFHQMQIDALHEAFCKGLGPLVGYGNEAIENTDRTIFSRYFTDDASDRSDVSETFKLMIDVNHGNGPNDILWKMIVDKNDYMRKCQNRIAGYHDVDPVDKYEKMHFCDVTFAQPVLPSDIECEDLNDKPDVEMDNLARIMLHEMLHNSQVGEFGPARQITDCKNNDNQLAYYPQRTHALVRENPGLAVINADNYAWLANNAYFKFACTNAGHTPPNNGNFNEPDNYAPGIEETRG